MNPTEFRRHLDETTRYLNPKEPQTLLSLLSGSRKIIEETMLPRWPLFAQHLSVGKSVCGKSWGSGQVAYQCKTCGADPTCIICVECFKNSDHTGHDYKMIRTAGGMCDCGDPDAWNPKGFCKDHQGIQENSDILTKIPRETLHLVTELVGFSVQTVLRCVQLLSTLPPSVDPGHLLQAVKFLMDGLMMVINAGTAGRRLVAHVVCEGTDAVLVPIFSLETSTTNTPWEGAMQVLHELVSTLLPDPWFKYRFAREFIRNYFDIHRKKMRSADTNQNVAEDKFLAHLSVQMLTVPSICIRLHKEDPSILHVILSTFLSAVAHMTIPPDLTPHHTGGHHRLSLSQPKSRRQEEEVYRILHDLQYVVTTDSELRVSLASNSCFVRALCHFLSVLQHSAFIYRVDSDASPFREALQMELTGSKVLRMLVRGVSEIRPELVCPSVQLSLRLKNHSLPSAPKAVNAIFSQYFLADVDQHPAHLVTPRDILSLVFDFALKFSDAYLGLAPTYHDLFHVFERDFLRDPKHGVTFLLPLPRLFAAICLEAAREGVHVVSDIAEIFPDGVVSSPTALSKVVEFPLVAQVLRCQVHERLWQRNHMNVHEQVFFYEAIVPATTLVPDINFLQIAACGIGPQGLLSQFCAKFLKWEPHEGVGLRHLIHLIIVVATNQWTRGNVASNRRQHIINCLAQGPQPHSELLKMLGTWQDDDSDEDIGDTDNIIASVAVKKTGVTPATFTLSDSAWNEVNVYDPNVHFRSVESIGKQYEDRFKGKVQGKVPHFLPRHETLCRAPDDKSPRPFESSLLLLHNRLAHHAMVAAIVASFVNERSPDPALGVALDGLLLALMTVAVRDRLRGSAVPSLAVRNDAKYCAAMDKNPLAAISLLPSAANFTDDVVTNLTCCVIREAPTYVVASQAVADDLGAKFRKGTHVRIQGLKKKPELNGEVGVINTFNHTSGRYGVVVNGEEYALQGANFVVEQNNDMGRGLCVLGKTPAEMLAELRSKERFQDYTSRIEAILTALGVSENVPKRIIGTEAQAVTKKQTAAERQARALERMRKQQTQLNFGDDKEEPKEPTSTVVSASPEKVSRLMDSLQSLSAEHQCVFCHDNVLPRETLGVIVSTVQGSVFKTLHKEKVPQSQGMSSEDWAESFPFEFGSVVCPPQGTLHLVACGHAVHEACLSNHLRYTQAARQRFEHIKGEHFLGANEFLCPLCGRLGHAAIPIYTGMGGGLPLLPERPPTVPLTSLLEECTNPVIITRGASDAVALSRCEAALFWLHAKANAYDEDQDKDEDNTDLLSGNIFETCVRVWMTQVALLEVQLRRKAPGAWDNPKLFHVLRLLLETALYFAEQVPSTEVRKEIELVRHRVGSMLRGESQAVDGEADPSPMSCNCFTLFVQFLFHILLRDPRAVRSHFDDALRMFTALERQQHGEEGIQVFQRQVGLVRCVVCPEDGEARAILSATERVVGEVVTPYPYPLPSVGMVLPPHGPLLLDKDIIALPYLHVMPHNYHDLINARHEEMCLTCGTAPRDPMLCLSCGAMLCFNATCCPREVSNHAAYCGGGSMVFLALRKSTTLLVNAGTLQAAFLPSLYLDDHGEEDVGLRRGKPIYKNAEAVRDMTQLWLSGGYFQDTATVLPRAILLRHTA